MRRKATGITLGAIASASYGTNPLFAIPMYSAGIDANSVLFYRYALAVIMYGLWLKFIKKTSFKISKNEILPLFILGIFFSLSSLTLFIAFQYIEAGIACTILFIYPVLVAFIMAACYKEKITKTFIFSTCLILSGIILLYHGKSEAVLSIKGILLVLGSALLYALYIVGVKNIKTVKHMNGAKMSFYVMLFGLFVYIINLKFCINLQPLNTAFLWCCAFALALFPTIISIETITISIKLIGSTTAAILGSLEPITAIIIGLLVFHEQLTLKIIIGIIAILTGVILIITRKRTIKDVK